MPGLLATAALAVGTVLTFAAGPSGVLSAAAAAAKCNTSSFNTHTCTHAMTNLSATSVTSPEQCTAACCAATTFTCNVAQWSVAGSMLGCFGGDVHKQPSCHRSPGVVSTLVNYVPAPPAPPPPPPPPPTALRLPKVIDSLMVLQRAPKAAQVWGWASPSARVSVSLDGATVATATSDATGVWKAALPPHSASINHTLVRC